MRLAYRSCCNKFPQTTWRVIQRECGSSRCWARSLKPGCPRDASPPGGPGGPSLPLVPDTVASAWGLPPSARDFSRVSSSSRLESVSSKGSLVTGPGTHPHDPRCPAPEGQCPHVCRGRFSNQGAVCWPRDPQWPCCGAPTGCRSPLEPETAAQRPIRRLCPPAHPHQPCRTRGESRGLRAERGECQRHQAERRQRGGSAGRTGAPRALTAPGEEPQPAR